MSVRSLYEQTLAERGYQSDPAQLRRVALEATLGERGCVQLPNGH